MSIEVQLVLGHRMDGTWLSLGAWHGCDSPMRTSQPTSSETKIRAQHILSLQSLASIWINDGLALTDFRFAKCSLWLAPWHRPHFLYIQFLERCIAQPLGKQDHCGKRQDVGSRNLPEASDREPSHQNLANIGTLICS